MKALLLILVACANTAPPSTSSISSKLTASSPCDTSAAVPGDGLDDYAVLQAALTARCAVQLETGDYNIATTDPRSNGMSRFDVIMIPAGASLRGVGPSTRLVFSGTAGMHDWRGIGLNGNDAAVSELAIDTAGMVGTSEQTHAIQIYGPALHVTVSRVWFNHPQRGAAAPGSTLGGGDCIKVVGYDTKRISATIADNQFTDCDRSGIATVGGFFGLSITGNTFHQSGDQDIDVEANNPGEDLVIANNVFLRGPKSASRWAVSLTAPGLYRFAVTGNVFSGRGVLVYTAKRGTFSGNTIVQTLGGSEEAVLRFIKASEEIAITGNTIIRAAASGDGPVLSMTMHSTGNPGTFVLTGNQLRNESAWPTVVLSSAQTLVATGNDFEWVPPTGAVLPAVRTLLAVSGPGARVNAVTLGVNMFRGPATHYVQFVGDNFGVGAVSLIGNTGIGGAAYGAKCSKLIAADGTMMGPVVSAGNNWPVSSGCNATSGGI